ncbi:hypothetical protein BDR07DRAFT_1502641 [Suillus spraguei]|nr:hypothetical protein BDR07DRAFT_1502641 [Suillus spraguei]
MPPAAALAGYPVSLFTSDKFNCGKKQKAMANGKSTRRHHAHMHTCAQSGINVDGATDLEANFAWAPSLTPQTQNVDDDLAGPESISLDKIDAAFALLEHHTAHKVKVRKLGKFSPSCTMCLEKIITLFIYLWANAVHQPKIMAMPNASDQKALENPAAWAILEQVLTTDLTYSDMEVTFNALALFSGDGDDNIALANLRLEKLKHLHSSPKTPIHKPRRPARSIFLDLDAGEDKDKDNEEDEFIVEGRELIPRSSTRFHSITQLPVAKHKFSTTGDRLQDRYANDAPRPSKTSIRDTAMETLEDKYTGNAASSITYVQDRMYLFYMQSSSFLIVQCLTEWFTGTVSQYITDYLEKGGFSVKVLPWSPGQLYIISNSPKTILESLPFSHSSCMKKWDRISEEEAVLLQRSTLKLDNPCWVRIKSGKYKNDIAYVFDPNQTSNFITVLIPPRRFLYPMDKGSMALFDKSRIPSQKSLTDIKRGRNIVGWLFKGEEY